MKVILAIGGAVIKTAHDELRRVVEQGKVEMLIHNGASLFHDFQRSTDDELKKLGLHSYSLSDLLKNPRIDEPASIDVWKWVKYRVKAPAGSVTRMCDDRNIPVLCFSALGCDFWHLFDVDWDRFAVRMRQDLYFLINRMRKGEFRYLLMGSAVIHPEIFRSALALSQVTKFTADVVDFLDMYRPRTRVACYGKYYRMEFKEYFDGWIKE